MLTGMTDFLPILLAILILVANAAYSAKWGFLFPFAAGIATVVSVVVFLLVFHCLPSIADVFLDLPLGWKPTIIIGLVFALLSLVLVRFPAVGGLKRLLGPDSPLHRLTDGVPAALLSLVPSVIAILFLFSCFRIAGTNQELRYVAALSQDGVESMSGKIPPYPQSEQWRAKIEALPGVSRLLDRMDPFSPPLYRNSAAVVLLDQAPALRAFLMEQSETAPIFSQRILDMEQFPGLQKAMQEQDLPAIVLDPELREKALDSELSPDLKALQLRPVLERFVESLTPPEDSGSTIFSN